MESTEQEQRTQSLAMLALAAAVLAASLLALMWWKIESAGAATDPGTIVFISSRNATYGNYYDIYSMAPDGTDIMRITNRPGNEYWPSLSSDGQKIAFMSDNSITGREPCCYDVFTINSDGSGEVNVTNTPEVQELNPTFSPDGQRIAFTRGHDIYAVRADGSGGQINLTNTDDNSEYYPAYSPDGSKIAYTSHTYYDFFNQTNLDIYVSSADGSGGRTKLTKTESAGEYYPSFSPDGSKIAYVRGDNGGEINLYTMNSDGANQRLVAHLPGYEYVPDWSPDGTQLAFSSVGIFTGNHHDVFKINADGSGWENLTYNFNVDDVLGSWGGAGARDGVAPVLTLPPDMVEEAASSGGAQVSFQASAIDDLDGPLQEVSCSPASGSTFPIGTTSVECSATDAAGNVGRGSFNVTVRDTTAPAISGVPQEMTEEATGPSGAQVSWQAPTATDLVDANVNVECTPSSNSTFALGATTVSCTASDSSGNSDTKTFKVTVKDTTAPAITGVPQDIAAKATSSSGAEVSYTPPTATDLVDGNRSVECSPASGSVFPLGTTQVSCSASDTQGNSDTKTFNVKISYDFKGFFEPVDNLEVATNSVKAGSAVPVKFTLGGARGLNIFEAGYPKSQQIPNPQATVDGIEQTVTAGSSGLSYDPATRVYTYVWKTEKAWAGSYRQLVVKLADGEFYRANFMFTK